MAAFLSALWLHPRVVKIAIAKGITDKPNKRKLQREPIPVLGGVVVYFGIMMGVGCSVPFCDAQEMTVILALGTLMLYTGTMDDIIGLTPKFRFTIETLSVLAVMFIGGYSIYDFHGVWGIGRIPMWVEIPLTIVAVVGIINSINLIDGVDGLSSGYCMMACAVFGAYFGITGDIIMAILAIACIGALIPFFGHNVFGKKSKMFIGDGGTLLMGMIMSLFVLNVLQGSGSTALAGNFGFVPFTLAVMAIPVFDTVRVMVTRIIRKTSPFNPDKKHLHHAFIELGFSHLATTVTTLLLNMVIIAVWFLLYMLGASVNVQFMVVLIVAAVLTVGVYGMLRHLAHKKAAKE